MMALRLHMHFGDERAGGVDLVEIAPLGRRRHRFRHAMGGEDDRPVARRDLVELVDEDGAFALQIIDHVFVVNDLVAHIDRRAMQRQCALDNVDGPHHAGAEAARRGEQDFERRFAHEA